MSQKKLAQELRLKGLSWTRTTAVEFETRGGKTKRDISLGEALALAAVLDVPLAELVTSESEVVNGDGRWAPAYVLAVIDGTANRDDIHGPAWDREMKALDWQTIDSEAASMIDRKRSKIEREGTWIARWDLERDPDRLASAAAQIGEAERAAAEHVANDRRVQVDPEDILFAADRLWGRSIEEERDRLLSMDPRSRTEDVARIRALRGQVTRRLYRDLSEELDSAVDRQVRKEADR